MKTNCNCIVVRVVVDRDRVEIADNNGGRIEIYDNILSRKLNQYFGKEPSENVNDKVVFFRSGVSYKIFVFLKNRLLNSALQEKDDIKLRKIRYSIITQYF